MARKLGTPITSYSSIAHNESTFDIKKQVGEIKVENFFGDNETNEGSICTILDGIIDRDMLSQLFVTEGDK